MPTDDNPFARNSVWPKMPQTPFRVTSLPRPPERAEPPPMEPLAPAEPPRQTITPVFVRSTEDPSPAFTRPVAAPPPVRTAPPVLRPPPEAPPPPVVVAVETPFVAPTPRSVPFKAPIWPGLIATAVGLAGIAGLVLLLTRDEPAPPAAPQPAIVVAPQAAPAPVVDTPALAVPVDTVRREPAASPTRTRPRRATPAPDAAPISRAADAAQAAFEAPVLVLPPVPTAVEAPPFKPDAAPDPNAPITTRRPYG